MQSETGSVAGHTPYNRRLSGLLNKYRWDGAGEGSDGGVPEEEEEWLGTAEWLIWFWFGFGAVRLGERQGGR